MKAKPFFSQYVDNLYSTNDIYGMSDSMALHEVLDDFHKTSKRVWKDAGNHDETSKEKFLSYKEEAKLLLHSLNNESTQQHNHQKISFLSIGRIVACAGILIIGISLFHKYLFTEPSTQYFTAYTKLGETKDITLPDGTLLSLNSCSSVKYPKTFNNDTREIDLSGEAFLEVAHDEEKPFIVHTSDMSVRVLGTKFNIKAYPTDQQTSVYVKQGKVKVSVPDADICLNADETLSLDKTHGTFNKDKQGIDWSTWRLGHLEYDNTPLRDVIHELERLYGVKIEGDKALFSSYSLTGEHENPSLESVLKSIRYTIGIKYRIEGQKVILYK